MIMLLKRIFFFLLLPSSFVLFAREPVFPVHSPESFVQLGGLGELRDDVYSADLNLAGAYAPCKCFSVFGDFAYRFVSYEYNLELHDQIHEVMDLRVNGLNESYVGVKMMPFPLWGVDVTWRFPPRGGSQVNRFHRFGISPFGLYELTQNMTLGAAIEFFTFLEKSGFRPGDELGLKGSISWTLPWYSRAHSGWKLDYVFLYRWRIQESRNLNLDKPYRKMDDLYRGFKMHVDAVRYFTWLKKIFEISLSYEINRGYLFGMETGHAFGFNARMNFD